ncbi:MAG: Hsp20/alpha crystallin family protein [Rubrivivax sp.]|nr:Hsp20/alpha crystallin family protein [Rubrivivax sp.]
MKIDELRQGFGALRDTVAGTLAEGWERLRRKAAGALTRYKPGGSTALPPAADIDDPTIGSGPLWAMVGGDVFEDDRRVVVRLEAPGMAKDDFTLEVLGDTLVVRGEKRFQRESSEGRWRVVQCAYGSFQRAVPLPAPVLSDSARATYRDGVLRVELPKREPRAPSVRAIPVS